ncbi:GNAT family N-acetyltransferase [Xanthomonas sacchari]|uniref:GNAT family N-acetyltransferase n=1 Tax=Xanthomonas sacchari TaxID=56458 RepID=UPI0020C41AEF|nr:GNAT family N-acetyltransferase [Xanthomonas sacchari]
MSLHFACPAPLSALGMAIRPECAADMSALRALLREERWAEFAMLPWDDTAKAALLDQQVQAQRRHYALLHPDALFLVLAQQESVVGRLYLAATDEGDLRVLDILLSSDYRRQGIGTILIGAVLNQARAEGRRVLLEVKKGNPAVGLYHRLGFQKFADAGISWHMAWRPALSDSQASP